MPYPSKTDREVILAAAIEQLAREGVREMSLRHLAASLDLAPNALYRYFGNRAELEAAMTAESARQLRMALARAVKKKEPVEAIRSMARAYVRFAFEHRHLYDMMMLPSAIPPKENTARQDFWAFFEEQVAPVSSAERSAEAAMALWAFLHGVTALRTAQVFGKAKPFSSFEFGLNAWLAAASGL